MAGADEQLQFPLGYDYDCDVSISPWGPSGVVSSCSLFMRIKNGREHWVYKKIPEKGSITEDESHVNAVLYEAYAMYLFYLIGNGVSCLVDFQAAGGPYVATQFIYNFDSMLDCFTKRLPDDYLQLERAAKIKLLTGFLSDFLRNPVNRDRLVNFFILSMLVDDQDVNPGNIGVDARGTLFRIDTGWAFYKTRWEESDIGEVAVACCEDAEHMRRSSIHPAFASDFFRDLFYMHAPHLKARNFIFELLCILELIYYPMVSEDFLDHDDLRTALGNMVFENRAVQVAIFKALLKQFCIGSILEKEDSFAKHEVGLKAKQSYLANLQTLREMFLEPTGSGFKWFKEMSGPDAALATDLLADEIRVELREVMGERHCIDFFDRIVVAKDFDHRIDQQVRVIAEKMQAEAVSDLDERVRREKQAVLDECKRESIEQTKKYFAKRNAVLEEERRRVTEEIQHIGEDLAPAIPDDSSSFDSSGVKSLLILVNGKICELRSIQKFYLENIRICQQVVEKVQPLYPDSLFCTGYLKEQRHWSDLSTNLELFINAIEVQIDYIKLLELNHQLFQFFKIFLDLQIKHLQEIEGESSLSAGAVALKREIFEGINDWAERNQDVLVKNRDSLADLARAVIVVSCMHWRTWVPSFFRGVAQSFTDLRGSISDGSAEAKLASSLLREHAITRTTDFDGEQYEEFLPDSELYSAIQDPELQRCFQAYAERMGWGAGAGAVVPRGETRRP